MAIGRKDENIDEVVKLKKLMKKVIVSLLIKEHLEQFFVLILNKLEDLPIFALVTL